MLRRPIRKTDIGTILLHWLLVVTLLVSIATGLRIAADSAERRWLVAFDSVLPRSVVWTGHMPAAVVLFALSIAYATYVSKAGLFRRIQPDRTRIMGLFGRSRVRWGALNVILYWTFFAAMLTELVTGGMLYLGHGGQVVDVHRFATWIIIGYAFAHVLVHSAMGGLPQLLRIFKPTALAPPPPPFDPLDLLDLAPEPVRHQVPDRPAAADRPTATDRLAAHGSPAEHDRFGPVSDHPATVSDDAAAREAPHAAQRQQPAAARHSSRPSHHVRSEQSPSRRTQRGTVLQANPLVVAIAAGLTAASVLLTFEHAARDTLHIRRIVRADAPVLDGDVSDSVWRSAVPVVVLSQQGANFDGTGETRIEIRGVHDGEFAYFSFVWDDPTRSLKHLPLVKTSDGWRVLQEKFDRDDEDSYFEDKFSVLVTSLDAVIPGDRTFHAGKIPVARHPGAQSLSGRGLHFTSEEGLYVDVWEWKATSSGPLGWMDDNHFGPAAEPSPDQIAGRVPYKGGFAPDPGTLPYTTNFALQPVGGYAGPIEPKRLPKDWRSTWTALGKIDLNPDHGDGEGSRWWMTVEDSVPYTREADAAIPTGTIIPGVIITGGYAGDQADIRCAARWAAGRWTLEVARRLDTKSPYDAPIRTGSFMRVAAFDHTQSHHTRSVRPIGLEVEQCGKKCSECLSTMKSSQPSEVPCFSTPP